MKGFRQSWDVVEWPMEEGGLVSVESRWLASAPCANVESFSHGDFVAYQQQLRELLWRKSLARGSFKLASGRRSDYYLDCKLTTLDPDGAPLTGRAILELLKEKHIKAEAIGGMSMGADPIVSAVVTVSKSMGQPIHGFLIRKEPKEHGRGKQIEGFEAEPGTKVIVVDEVCTTGKSTLDAVRVAEEKGFEVVAVVILVDREEGGDELREKFKSRFFHICTVKELFALEEASRTRESVGVHARR